MDVIDYGFIMSALGWAVSFHTMVNNDEKGRVMSGAYSMIAFVVLMGLVTLVKLGIFA